MFRPPRDTVHGDEETVIAYPAEMRGCNRYQPRQAKYVRGAHRAVPRRYHLDYPRQDNRTGETSMKSWQQPDYDYVEIILKRAAVGPMDEPTTDRPFLNIVVRRSSPEYEAIKIRMCCECTFDLVQIQTIAHQLYFVTSSNRKDTSRTAIRAIFMAAVSTSCYYVNGVGHMSCKCPVPAKNNNGR